MSFYDFFEKIGVVKNENWLKYRELIRSGVFDMIQLEGVCIVATRPTAIRRDNRNNLHSEDGPAIEWKDGYKLWYLHGVHVEPEMHKDIVGGKMSFAEIMDLKKMKNMEHRMIALKYLNPEELLKGAEGKLLDKSPKANELWLIDNKEIFPQPEFFLKYPCPSTDRVYLKCVEREWALLPDGNLSADKAQASSHRFTLEDYLQLEVQS